MQVLEAKTEHSVQTTGYYCGAACSQMLLSRVNLPTSQDQLYELIQSFNIEPEAFYSDPRGISELLNSPGYDAYGEGSFVISMYEDNSEIGDHLFDSIFDSGSPSICLVNSGNHWVVCHKLIYDVTTNRSVKLLGVFLLDPSPSSPPEVYIPIDRFLSDILNHNKFGTTWRDKRVLISASKAKQRSESVALAGRSSTLKGGGGSMSDLPDSAEVTAALREIGVAGAKQPLGGGANAMPIVNLADGTKYYIMHFDARSDTIFNGMLFAAVSPDNSVLEVTMDTGRPFFAPDTLANEVLRSDPSTIAFELDKQLYWRPDSILRNRFMIARRATSGEKEVWILPTGELHSDLAVTTRGGR